MAKPESDKRHHNNFDGLRLLAALLVLFSHMFALSGRWEPRFIGDHSFGNLGVLIFFSISGYLISASWFSDPNIFRFSLRRFLRIVPGLTIAIIISWTVVTSLGLSRFPGNPLHALNGSLWTIPYEIYCYILIASLGLLTRSPALVLSLTLLVAYAFLPKSFLSYFGLFFAGGALLQQYVRLRSVYALLGFFLSSAMFLSINETIIGLALIIPPATVWIGTQSWPVLNMAGRKGDISYGIYIYAWPIQQIVVTHVGSTSPYIWLLLPSLTITLAVAWLSWHLVEHPALLYKPKKNRFSASRDHSAVRQAVNEG